MTWCRFYIFPDAFYKTLFGRYLSHFSLLFFLFNNDLLPLDGL
jgi:hypothetical protein